MKDKPKRDEHIYRNIHDEKIKEGYNKACDEWEQWLTQEE